MLLENKSHSSTFLKMRTVKRPLLLFLFVFVSSVSLIAMSTSGGSESESVETPPPYNAVGKVMMGNGVQIFYNRLVPYFTNGDLIAEFIISDFNGHWKLLRRGMQSNGAHMTEIIDLERDHNDFLLVSPDITFGKGCSTEACSSGCMQSPNEGGGGDCECEAGGCSPSVVSVNLNQIVNTSAN